MPKILNKKHGNVAGPVYVGRPSKFGNPFVIGKDGNRDQVIKKYRNYVLGNKSLLESIKSELHGKDLICWCYPLPYHAEVLIEIANSNVGQ